MGVPLGEGAAEGEGGVGSACEVDRGGAQGGASTSESTLLKVRWPGAKVMRMVPGHAGNQGDRRFERAGPVLNGSRATESPDWQAKQSKSYIGSFFVNDRPGGSFMSALGGKSTLTSQLSEVRKW